MIDALGIRVVEQFVEGKSTDRVCEVMIVVTDHFAAVIDGASDATGARFAGKTGGRFAAEVVAAASQRCHMTPTARAFADTLAQILTKAVAAVGDEVSADTRWPVAVLTCASAHRREVWRIGDGHVVLDGDLNTGGSRIGKAACGFRAAVNAALLNKGMPLDELIETDPGAHARRQLIDIQQHLANEVGPWGYGCINGQRVPDEYIEVMSIPKGGAEIIIASDGYLAVLSTLAETEAQLRLMMQRDPAAIGELWPIGKSTRSGANAPDDRAYLRFTVE